MHMLARVCFFRIGPQAARDKASKSTELSASGALDFSVPADSVAWQGHWDIAPRWGVSPGGNARAIVAPSGQEATQRPLNLGGSLEEKADAGGALAEAKII